MLAEESDSFRFISGCGFSAEQMAKKEQLICVVGDWRRSVKVPVEQRQELGDLYRIARFFFYFPNNGGAGGITTTVPPSPDSPAAALPPPRAQPAWCSH